jgi:wobble nucleotide-excising tRNase
MRIDRVTRINHHIFRDFAWPADLLPFGQFNLIYGWNASGKTTLSSLFHHIQTHTAIEDGQVEFEMGGAKVSGRELATARLPDVRVFNKDVVASSILADCGQMEPIYYLGKESVEKQKRVIELGRELGHAQTQLDKAESKKRDADSELDSFCMKRAKTIKDVLTSARYQAYNNYNKAKFRTAADHLTKQSANAALLSNEQKDRLKRQINSLPKGSIAELGVDVPDFDQLAAQVGELLTRSVVSEVIEELRADPVVGEWVQQGLSFHSGTRETNTCRFCGERISAARIRRLEAHFSNELRALQVDLEQLAQTIHGHRASLSQLSLPLKSQLYEHLVSALVPAEQVVLELQREAIAYLDVLSAALTMKRDSPFAAMDLEAACGHTPCPDRAMLLSAIQNVNALVRQHNTATDRFQSELREAFRSLEACFVAEAHAEYRKLHKAVATTASTLEESSGEVTRIRTEIQSLERDIGQHQEPARELNEELRSYLGHTDLSLEVKETGYSMTRHGQPATDLSEGEKTAIAFLYFLKSLRDKDFDLSKGVVVVDDPVSSLDANALFCAFAYMKERTKTAGQLFILTHNFAFFRQVKEWFSHLPRQRRLFMLRTTCPNGKRAACIAALDPLLEHYESEYHYLFKCIYNEATSQDEGLHLGRYYGIPNQARRLVEAFLAFRLPHISGDLYGKFEKVNFDPGKKTRILRFVNTYSHSDAITEPDQDPSILGESKSVLRDLLEMMKCCDEGHYSGMVTVVRQLEDAQDE